MRRQFLVAVLCVSAVVFVASAGALAQGPRPQAPSTSLDSKFTYQGQLKRNNAPYSGTCNMQFGLFDAPSGGTPAGIVQTLPNVNVSNGLFTVVLNDAGQFSGSAFSGAARWLEAAVQCSGDGGYTTLTRQQLTAVPYALYATGNWALSGNGGTNPNTNYLGTSDNAALTIGVSGTAALRMVPSADSPILMGGYGGNLVMDGADGASIGGGGSPVFGANVISGTNVAYSAIAGGVNNRISGNAYNATIGGGYGNAISGTVDAGWSLVAGGHGNMATGNASTVGGGQGNTVSGDFSTVSGGYGNTVAGTAHGATIAGGGSDVFGGNVVSGTNVTWSTIGGGVNNRISGNAYNATIGGGFANVISGTVDASRSVIAGGWNNVASGPYSAVSGGWNNAASGAASTVSGGYLNTASGVTSFAAGKNAHAAHDGAFVWADGSGAPISSTAANQFIVRASGGITLFSNSAAGNGVTVAPGSGAWSMVSDRNAKMAFAAVDGREVLGKLASVPIETWSYKTQDASIRHIGPMAQDFRREFGVGENDTTISTVDEEGVALAAIQGLNQMVQQQQAEIAQLRAQVNALSQGSHTIGPAAPADGLLPALVGLSLVINGLLGAVVVIHVRK